LNEKFRKRLGEEGRLATVVRCRGKSGLSIVKLAGWRT
jgi:hypothetical protein